MPARAQWAQIFGIAQGVADAGLRILLRGYLDLASGWRGVQSFGGKATRQKAGSAKRNSTPIWRGAEEGLSMWATRHSMAALVERLVRVRRWPRKTGALRTRSAPWALTATVCVSSSHWAPDGSAVAMRMGSFIMTRWLRRRL